VKRGAAGKAAGFWDKEYGAQSDGSVELFKLSTEPGSDFLKFIDWLEKVAGKGIISRDTKFADTGCGNGRHAIYLAHTYGAHGVAYDISSEAVRMARENMEKGRTQRSGEVEFLVQNINQPIHLEDSSLDLIIDAMASHVLRKSEREFFLSEEVRILQTGGYIFLKTFLHDGDTLAVIQRQVT
jgi:SAM-dependent methyltransferase